MTLDDLVEPSGPRRSDVPAALDLEVDGNLADALGEMGHKVSPDTVGRLLQAIGFSLQATAKQRET